MINFNGGDFFFSLGCRSVNYNGSETEWALFIEKYLIDNNITHLLVYNDCRPLHRIAIQVANKLDCKVYIFEEGYLRPSWITLEEGGVNGFSRIPNNTQWYLRNKVKYINSTKNATFGSTLLPLIIYCILYHTFQVVFAMRFYKYRTHRPNSLLQDILGWLRRLRSMPYERSHARKVQIKLLNENSKYYLFALQLSSDSQIWQHSPYRNNIELMDEVLASFALNAPPDTLLIVKQHPLDNGGANYRRYINAKIHELGLMGRVYYVSGGHLPTLIKKSLGVIVVNSTVGMSSLYHKAPTIALGKSIYNIEGLTYQGGLDQFWTQGLPPDYELYKIFRNYLLKHNQLNGNFYAKQGIDHLLPLVVRKLTISNKTRNYKLKSIHRKHAEVSLHA